MKLQQLRYLLAVQDNGLNITAAADRLYTSQPGVSKQIRMLEDELGLQIFLRAGKSISGITPAGKEVLRRAQRIMSEVHNIRDLASDLNNADQGSLSIATTHTQARYVLPAIITQFRKQFPQVKVHLQQGTTEQITQMLNDGIVDFAIASGENDQLDDIIRLPAYQWDRTIVVPKGHALVSAERPISLDTLAKHPLATYVFSLGKESSFKNAFKQAGLEPDIVFTARDADVIKTYVAMHVGVGIIASVAFDPHADARLEAIPATGLFPRLTTWIGYRRDRFLRSYMKDFITLFANHLDEDLIDSVAVLPDQAAIDDETQSLSVPLRNSLECSPVTADNCT